MKKIIIHAGLPKTGTSSIQNYCWSLSHRGLAEFYYPKDVDINQIFFSFSLLDFKSIEKTKGILKMFSESDNQVMFISAENLVELAQLKNNPDELLAMNFIQELQSVFSSFTCSLLFSSCDHLKRAESSIVEIIKKGGSFKEKSILQTLRDLTYFNPELMYKFIPSALNIDEVMMFKVEDNLSIYRAILPLLGQKLDMEEIERIPRFNISPPPVSLIPTESINRFYSSISADDNLLRAIEPTFQEINLKIADVMVDFVPFFDSIGVNNKMMLFSFFDSNYENDVGEINNFVNDFASVEAGFVDSGVLKLI